MVSAIGYLVVLNDAVPYSLALYLLLGPGLNIIVVSTMPVLFARPLLGHASLKNGSQTNGNLRAVVVKVLGARWKCAGAVTKGP